MAQCMSPAAGVAARTAAPAAVPFTGLARVSLPVAKSVKKSQWVSNGIKTRQMLVWEPNNNKYFETLSYLPPLSESDIAKQVDYVVGNGWTPCLEFSDPEHAYVSSHSTIRMGPVTSNYVDNRYWTMFKLPMFGVNDASQVLKEVQECTTKFPNAYIRLVAFDAVRQVQVAMVLVHRPPQGTEYRKVEERSV